MLVKHLKEFQIFDEQIFFQFCSKIFRHNKNFQVRTGFWFQYRFGPDPFRETVRGGNKFAGQIRFQDRRPPQNLPVSRQPFRRRILIPSRVAFLQEKGIRFHDARNLPRVETWGVLRLFRVQCF